MNFKGVIRLLLGSLYLFTLVSFTGQSGAVAHAATSHRTNPHKDIVATDGGIHFTLDVADFTLTADGRLAAPNLNSTILTAGAPELPYYTALIALPPGASADVSVRETNVAERTAASIRPVGRPVSQARAQNGTLTTLDQFDFVYAPDPGIYAADTLYPPHNYTVSAPRYYRDVRMVELSLYPLRYNPATRTLHHVAQMQVDVTFTGGSSRSDQAAFTPGNATANTLADVVLNPEQATKWRDAPAAVRSTTAGTQLPVGQTAYKITVTQDGIYEITRTQLASAGFPVDSADPKEIEILVQSQAVHYEIVNHDDNGRFDETEAVRFYGWAFDGPTEERLYVPLQDGSDDANQAQNVFWLWVGANPQQIAPAAVPNTTIGTLTTYTATVTAEKERLFSSTKLDEDDWQALPNEPDNMYWDLVTSTTISETGSPEVFPQTINLPIYLPHPAADGPDATLTVELLSRAKDVINPQSFTNHKIVLDVNGQGHNFEENWTHLNYINATHAVTSTSLLSGNNTIAVTNESLNPPPPPNYASVTSEVYVNRITVEYLAELTADDDQLIFQPQAGAYDFEVGGFTENNAGNMLAWDISTRTAPKSIALSGAGGGSYTFTFEGGLEADIIVTPKSNTLSPAGISAYTVPNLDPPGGADWVAITHADFMNAAQELAAHRAAHSGVTTHVVDAADVMNQYGYGLPTPQGIRAYILHAYNDWPTRPADVLLIGDASFNPRRLDCSACDEGGGDWSITDDNYVPAFFKFVDRFQGSVPSDYPYALMDNDLYPDLAVGRLSVETAAQANVAVEKIRLYEENLLTPREYQQNILFVHDDEDDGGDFYEEVYTNTVQSVDGFGNFNNSIMGLPQFPTDADFNSLRTDMFTQINSEGITLLNWRGHGSVDTWGQKVLRVDPDALPGTPFSNFNKPFVTISMDCLDGSFIYPGWYSLSESLLRLEDAGSAGHWSSSGLGFTHEHTILAQAFYAGVFQNGLTRLGAAVNHAKMVYTSQGQHPSELYAFILQGDPAMQLFQPELSLSAVVDPANTPLEAGEEVDVTFTLANDGSYPSQATLRYPLPTNLSYVSHTSDIPATLSTENGVLTFTFQEGLDYQATTTLSVTLQADSSLERESSQATVSGTGLDISPQTGRRVTVTIGGTGGNTGTKLYLPVIIH